MTDDIKPTVPDIVHPPAVTSPAGPVLVPSNKQPAGILIKPVSIFPNSPSTETTKPIVKPVLTEKLTELANLHTKIQEILKNHGGMESNIPLNHEYWGLLNTYRGQVNAKY